LLLLPPLLPLLDGCCNKVFAALLIVVTQICSMLHAVAFAFLLLKAPLNLIIEGLGEALPVN
jgi:hypothetical protein